MKINEISAEKMMVKSSLPASDYVVNPYVGCTHACKYCYACFMKRFTGHGEDWGTFLDVKRFRNMKLPRNLEGKVVLLSSVTDPYNPYEKKYHATREALKVLVGSDANVEILSKSDLMLEDMELLKSFRHLRVGISICTLDDGFRKAMEPGAPSIRRRLEALKALHDAGISTYVFISPIFPMITDVDGIIREVSDYVDEICFENLNLRGNAKTEILEYIREQYPEHYDTYRRIYTECDLSYWTNLEKHIKELSACYDVKFTNYFYHEKIRKGAGQNG